MYISSKLIYVAVFILISLSFLPFIYATSNGSQETIYDYQKVLLDFYSKELTSHGAILFAASIATITFFTKFKNRELKDPINKFSFIIIGSILISAILYIGIKLVWYGHISSEITMLPKPLPHDFFPNYCSVNYSLRDFTTQFNNWVFSRSNEFFYMTFIGHFVSVNGLFFNPIPGIIILVLTGLPFTYIYFSAFYDSNKHFRYLGYFLIIPIGLIFIDAIYPSKDIDTSNIFKILASILTFYFSFFLYYILIAKFRKHLAKLSEDMTKFLTFIVYKVEKLEITSAYASSVASVILNVKNKGSADATITEIFINNKLLSTFSYASNPQVPFLLKKGVLQTFKLTFNTALASGATYYVKLQTSSGTNYSKAVVIP